MLYNKFYFIVQYNILYNILGPQYIVEHPWGTAHDDPAPSPVRLSHYQTQTDAPRTATLSAPETDQPPRRPPGDPPGPGPHRPGDQIYPQEEAEMFTLESLPVPGEGTLTDHRTIHNMVTAHFTQWYKGPATPEVHWVDLSQDRAAFLEHTAHRGIPTDLGCLLWQALTDVPGVDLVRRDLATELAAPPTLGEFNGIIASHRGSTTPGATGLTYNMVKGWPAPVRAYAHTCLVALWDLVQLGHPPGFRLSPTWSCGNQLDPSRCPGPYRTLARHYGRRRPHRHPLTMGPPHLGPDGRQRIRVHPLPRTALYFSPGQRHPPGRCIQPPQLGWFLRHCPPCPPPGPAGVPFPRLGDYIHSSRLQRLPIHRRGYGLRGRPRLDGVHSPGAATPGRHCLRLRLMLRHGDISLQATTGAVRRPPSEHAARADGHRGSYYTWGGMVPTTGRGPPHWHHQDAGYDIRHPRPAAHAGTGNQTPPRTRQRHHMCPAIGGQCGADRLGQLPHPSVLHRTVHTLVSRRPHGTGPRTTCPPSPLVYSTSPPCRGALGFPDYQHMSTDENGPWPNAP